MKLLACHIENFGKLHDLDFDFSSGTNVFMEENGWGKSTFAAFIRAIFFGLDERGGRKKEERKRFAPWQGGAFGGSITFEVSGNQYIATRSFGTKDADDTFELRNASSNVISTDYSERLGEELFHIDKASFSRTAFIAQRDCETYVTDDINAKVGNLTEATDDINNYASADETLKDLINKMSPTRATGSINRRASEINALERIVKDGEGISESIASLQESIKATAVKKDEAIEERKQALLKQNEISAMQGILAKKRELIKLRQKAAQTSEDYEKARAFFEGNIPEESVLEETQIVCNRIDECNRRIRELKLPESDREELSTLKGKFAEGAPSEAELQNVLSKCRKRNELIRQLMMQAALNPKAVRNGKTAGICVMVLGVLLLIAGIATLFANVIVGCILVVLGVIAAVIGGFMMHRTANLMRDIAYDFSEYNRLFIREQELDLAGREAEERRLSEEIISFISKYVSCSAEDDLVELIYEIKDKTTRLSHLDNINSKYNEVSSTRDELSLRLDICMQQLDIKDLKAGNPISGDLTVEVRARLALIREHMKKLEMAKTLMEAAQIELEAFEKDNDLSIIDVDIKEPEQSTEEIGELIAQLQAKTDQLHETMLAYDNRLDELQIAYDDWENDKNECEELKQLQTKEKKKYELLKVSRDYLGKAKESMTSKYTAPLMTSFNNYYKLITGKDAGQYKIDANAEITALEHGKQRDVSSMSMGYRDLIGVCLRVALIDAMYEDEKPVIVMDDPFVNLDDEKLSLAGKFMDEVAKQYQIIYFTCSDNRRVPSV